MSHPSARWTTFQASTRLARHDNRIPTDREDSTGTTHGTRVSRIPSPAHRQSARDVDSQSIAWPVDQTRNGSFRCSLRVSENRARRGSRARSRDTMTPVGLWLAVADGNVANPGQVEARARQRHRDTDTGRRRQGGQAGTGLLADGRMFAWHCRRSRRAEPPAGHSLTAGT